MRLLEMLRFRPSSRDERAAAARLYGWNPPLNVRSSALPTAGRGPFPPSAVPAPALTVCSGGGALGTLPPPGRLGNRWVRSRCWCCRFCAAAWCCLMKPCQSPYSGPGAGQQQVSMQQHRPAHHSSRASDGTEPTACSHKHAGQHQLRETLYY